MSLKEYILATRPWSFTAAIVPVLITSAVSNASLLSEPFLRCMVMAVAIQAGANLTNTYFDFTNDVDNKLAVLHGSGERTLVENKVSSTGVLLLSAICYLIGIFAVVPILIQDQNQTLTYLIAIGASLSFFYTATPIGLKYRALGDITIFLCFGPLLMQSTSILLTGSTRDDIYLYSIPIGLLTEAILHANNARDIDADSRVGAVTLATLLGLDASYTFFAALLYGSFLSVLVIAYLYHWGSIVALLTLPLAHGLLKRYKEKKMSDLPEETAKTHLPFGILLWLGIRYSASGLQEIVFK